MARNKVQFQKGMSEVRFDELYGTEPLCHAALVQWRWPHGFECPGCEGPHYYDGKTPGSAGEAVAV